MNREDLFAAIGCVEESRLARSEMTVFSENTKEEHTMKPQNLLRKLLIVAAVVSMLAVTAYAVTGFLIFDSPEQMVTAIFGDDTGFDHSDGSITKDPWGGPEGILVEPTFDRVPVDETLVAEELAPNVSIVGQSVSAKGYTVTVDAFLYDSATKCGILTYLLENPDGLPEYKLQTNGKITFWGYPDPVDINHYGYPYIIQEKTTDTCLAVAYYFMAEDLRDTDLVIGLHESVRYTPAETDAMLAQAEKQFRETMTEADVLALLEENLGKELFAQVMEEQGKDVLVKAGYADLAQAELGKLMDEDGETIRVSLDGMELMEHITAGDGSVIVSPISIFMDVRPFKFLHTDGAGNERISADNVDTLVIRYRDGSEYIVEDGYIINTMFAISYYPEGTTHTEHFVSAEEDPHGEGFSYMVPSNPQCLLTLAFNRTVDVERIDAVIVNGVEIPLG